MTTLAQTCAAIAPLDGDAMHRARTRQDRLARPAGALGQLEDIAVQLAGITGQQAPALARPTLVVAAASHGVAAENVSAYPATVTAQMASAILAGGAAVSVLARNAGADVIVVDAGVEPALSSADPRLRLLRIGPGTANLAHGPAMDQATAQRCIEQGIALAGELIAGGADLLALGELGNSNSTAAAAITALAADVAADMTTGPGSGLDDQQLRHKIQIVEQAIQRLPEHPEPLHILSEVGGFEIGLLAGLILGGAAQRVPILLDGFTTSAAALIAWLLSPQSMGYCIAAHRTIEPGHRIALATLGLRPLLALDLRMGEGCGAALALPLVRAAARLAGEMDQQAAG